MGAHEVAAWRWVRNVKSTLGGRLLAESTEEENSEGFETGWWERQKYMQNNLYTQPIAHREAMLMLNSLDGDGKVERRGRCRLPPRHMDAGPSRQSLTGTCGELSGKPRRRQGEGGKGRGIATSVDLVWVIRAVHHLPK